MIINKITPAQNIYTQNKPKAVNSAYKADMSFGAKQILPQKNQNLILKLTTLAGTFLSQFLTNKQSDKIADFETLQPEEQRECLKKLFKKDKCINKYASQKLLQEIKNNSNLVPLYKLYNVLSEHIDSENRAILISDIKEEDIQSKLELSKIIKKCKYRCPLKEFIMFSNINHKNLPFIKTLINDNPKFSELDILKIVHNLTDKSFVAKQQIYNLLNNVPDYSDFKTHILGIIEEVNEINLPLAQEIINDKTNSFNPHDIIEILKSVTKDNVECKMQILNLCKEQTEKDTRSSGGLNTLVKNTSKDNYLFEEELIKDKILPYYEIAEVAYATVEHIPAKLNVYRKIKYDYHKYSNDIIGILLNTNKYNEDLALSFINDNILDPFFISNILMEATTGKELGIYNMLKKREDIKECGSAIASILRRIDPNNIKYLIKLHKNEKCSSNCISKILYSINSNNSEVADKLILEPKREFNPENIAEILQATKNTNPSFTLNILKQDNSEIPEVDIIKLINNSNGYIGYYGKNYLSEADNITELYKNYVHQLELILKSPENYISGDIEDNYVNEECEKMMTRIMLASDIYDTATLNYIMRMRFDDAGEFMSDLSDLTVTQIKLLKNLSNCSNTNGEPLMPSQKVQLLNIVRVFDNHYINKDILYEMATERKVDLHKLESVILNKIIQKAGLFQNEVVESIPKEKLEQWNFKYVHLLPTANEHVNDIIRASFLEKNFKNYIHQNNAYGKANAQTKAQFQKLKLNYEKWVNPNKNIRARVIFKDENKEKVSQIAKQLEEDMTVLLNTPAKEFIKKQFGDCIENTADSSSQTRFTLPAEFHNNKTKLTEFLKVLTDTTKEGQLYQLWNRAKNNINNPDKKQNAQQTLTILNHLEQRLKDLGKIEKTSVSKNYDLTIKMWDRNPVHDIFQGNYSTCCIGMGEANQKAMPIYLLNTAFNMIEIVDNQTGNTIGNALCYFAKCNGEPYFIIDNIEIANSSKPSEKADKEIRNAVYRLASQIAKDVTGKNHNVIRLGGQFNDVNCDDLKIFQDNLRLIGNISSDEIYMDLFGGWVKPQLKSLPGIFYNLTERKI